jgi:hypothetical protein
MAKMVGANSLKKGDQLAYDYVVTFKDKADLALFQEDSELEQSFRIRTVSKGTVVVASPLQESQIRDYLLQHFQLGPDKVTVARYHNPITVLL